ncbi:unnamed protein product [Mycena citricolor]|uniref:Uncharacterized protein n=1 Tax=Mycena citricolor TaxID=2018698 RepID=A0AAD2H956_9AGAR|nr:unnamed protein product [Mycena citricolor]
MIMPKTMTHSTIVLQPSAGNESNAACQLYFYPDGAREPSISMTLRKPGYAGCVLYHNYVSPADDTLLARIVDEPLVMTYGQHRCHFQWPAGQNVYEGGYRRFPGTTARQFNWTPEDSEMPLITFNLEPDQSWKIEIPDYASSAELSVRRSRDCISWRATFKLASMSREAAEWVSELLDYAVFVPIVLFKFGVPENV